MFHKQYFLGGLFILLLAFSINGGQSQVYLSTTRAFSVEAAWWFCNHFASIACPGTQAPADDIGQVALENRFASGNTNSDPRDSRAILEDGQDQHKLWLPVTFKQPKSGQTQNQYSLMVSTVGSGNVSLDKTGPHHYGDGIQLTAAPDAGWTFDSWTGDLTGSTNPASITMDGDKSVTAHFTQIEYALTVATEGSGSVTRSNPGPYRYEDGVQLTAVPDTGWTFDSWTGDQVGGTNPVSITMDEDKSVTAHFTQKDYALTVTKVGSGSVTLSNPGPYHDGDVVQLTAAPDTGWKFSNWTGDLTGSMNPASITMDGNRSLTANFTQKEYTLTVTKVGSGSVTRDDPGPYHDGDVVQLTAAPDTGWRFSNWTGDLTGSTNPASITMNGNRSLTANFAQIEYTLTVTKVGSGSVTRNNPGPYYYGNVVQLTAAPDTGWRFSNWTGDRTGSTNPVSVTMDGNKSVTAHFAQIEYTLTVTTLGSGSVTRNNPGPYHYGDAVQLTAVPDASWKFANWMGDLTGNTNPVSITMVGNKSVTGIFSKYTLTGITVGSGSITRDNPGPYWDGDVVHLTAVPDVGWRFVNWTGDLSGNTNPASITMDRDKSVTAHFAQKEYTLTIATSGNGSVSCDNPGPYHYGDVVHLTATSETGWSFSSWTGSLEGSSNPITITFDGDMVVTAIFMADKQLPKNLILSQGTLREDFETMDGWTVSGSTPGYSAVSDTTNYRVGTQSIKMTTPGGGNVKITKSVDWDLSVQKERGNFRFWVYVYGPSEPADFQILMSNDSGFQNYFIAWYGDGFDFPYRPGWNLINLRTSDWNVGAGSPSWANPILRVQFRFDGTAANSYSLDGLSSGIIAQPVVLFTFDDGISSLYTQAYSYMNTHNVRGTGYIVTDWVNGTNQVTWWQLQAMYDAGWTIGNHTNTHPHLPLLSEAEQETEFLEARSALNAHGMTNVDYVGYPHGEYNQDTLSAMENLGMRNGRTLLYGNIISPVINPYEIPQHEVYSGTSLTTIENWVDTAVARDEILVIVFHGITTVPDPGSDDWSIDYFQSFVDYCIQQGVPFLTMDDLYRLQYGSVIVPWAR